MKQICVVYCSEQDQFIKYVDFEPNLSVNQAIRKSAILEEAAITTPFQCGVFSLKVDNPEMHILQAGDRVEIYRPLKMNPKDVRRLRAERHPVGRVLKGNQWRKKRQDTD